MQKREVWNLERVRGKKTNEQKFSLGGVECKKICSHPGRNLI